VADLAVTNLDLAIRFFLQLAVILAFCRLVGVVALRFRQPQVVAEMIAGVMLGPSLFGWILPDAQAWLFPWDPSQQTRDTQSYLFPASQLGLALYMFVVGLEFRIDVIRSRLRSSLAVSFAGMAAPFGLGALLALVLHGRPDLGLFGERVPAGAAALFLGACMCITAFPMLARIIRFKGLTGTTMGTVAIGAGAIDDAMAWCLLAVVLASLDDTWSQAFLHIGGAVGFAAVAFLVLRPLLARCQGWLVADERLTDGGFVVGLALMALGAWWTDSIHLHAVFGAFVMGAVMPRGAVARDLIARIEPLAVALLLPLFFTYSGLNTRIGLLDSWTLWLVCLAILLAATLGKGVACYFAARATGIPGREALGIGTLMNARGLMELIIVNIGLQKGVISHGLFAALVLMAVVTTLMASPIFDRLLPPRRDEHPRQPA
jgi:Kef-type K+ transport system membrane component KefB